MSGKRRSRGGGNTAAVRKGTSSGKGRDLSRKSRRALVPSRQREHPTLRALRASLVNTHEPALRDQPTRAIAALDQRVRP